MSGSTGHMSRRNFLKSGAALGGAGMLGLNRAAHGAPTQPKNIMFVMNDQWRAHALGFMNQDPVQTPFLDAFCREAVTFRNGIATAPVCSPNRGCLFTGRHIQNHGILVNNAAHVQPEHLLVPHLKQAGYRTAYIGKWHMGGSDYHGNTPPPLSLRQHYDLWYRSMFHTHFHLGYDINGEITDLGEGWQPDHNTDVAMDFINQDPQSPFFVVVSHAPPHRGNYPGFGEVRHTPGGALDGTYAYYAPSQYEELYKDLGPDDIRPNILPVASSDPSLEYESIDSGAIKGYFGACSAIDASFGRLIAFLKEKGLYDNTIVVFTADHGEYMGSHGYMTKGSIFEESLMVPLMIHVPGVEGRMDDLLFNSPDVMPTLFALASREIPAGVDGLDHSGIIHNPGDRTGEPDKALVGLYGWRGWRTKRYSYVTGLDGVPGGEVSRYLWHDHNKGGSDHVLWDLENDPYQQNPITLGDGTETDSLINHFQYQLHLRLASLGEEIPPAVEGGTVHNRKHAGARHRTGAMLYRCQVDGNSIEVSFFIDEPASVDLSLFSPRGKKVASLVNEKRDAGLHRVRIGRKQVASGTYLVKLKTKRSVAVKEIRL